MPTYAPWVVPALVSTNEAELNLYSDQVNALLGFPNQFGTSYGSVEPHPRNGEPGWADVWRYSPEVLREEDSAIAAHLVAHGVQPTAKLWEHVTPPTGTMKVWNPLDPLDPTNDCFWVGEGGDGTYDDWV